jgi:tetratricopeptide (TPR) repeat protein
VTKAKPDWVLDVEQGRTDWGDDPEETARLFEAEIERGEWLFAALVGLGGLRERELDDVPGAIECFRRVIELADPKWVPHALISLGYALERAGDNSGADDALERATTTEFAPLALLALGDLAQKQGQQARAAERYRQAADTGDPHRSPQALFNLAQLLHRQGDVGEATAAFERLSDEGEWAAQGLLGLAHIKRDTADAAGAEALYRRIIGEFEGVHQYWALIPLRGLLIKQGRRDDAWAAYLEVVDDEREERTGLDYNLLGTMLEDASDYEAAKDAYRRGATTDDMFGRWNLRSLGDMQRTLGEADAARETYLRVISSEDETDRAVAAIGLRELMRAAGDGAWSRETYERACAAYPAAVKLGDYEAWVET